MDNNQKPISDQQMLEEILKISRQTKNYMKWQLYITVILVVLPLLSMAILLPFVMKGLGSLSNVYLNGLQ